MRTKRLRVPLAALAGVAGLIAVAQSAVADEGQSKALSKPTTIVSMGDSFISGEAGRWNGNSLENSGNRLGTDRAFVNGAYDQRKVYVANTADNGCHRSDVSEVTHSTGLYQTTVNLACSGAVAQNVFRAEFGGVSFKGELPQADHLGIAAKDRDVKVIALSVGGNDLGFSDVIGACVKQFTLSHSPCHAPMQDKVDAKMPSAMKAVGKAIDEVRSTMTLAGYSSSQYRIILQSYPSPVPRAADSKWVEQTNTRWTYGCPLYDTDLTWARDTLVPSISANLKQIAHNKGTEFLDLQHAFDGREVCAKKSSVVDHTHPATSETAEWVRWLNSGLVQGDQQESLHPNAFGQQALGTCLKLHTKVPRGNYDCRNIDGRGASAMLLNQTS